jgi:hypothetical protein
MSHQVYSYSYQCEKHSFISTLVPTSIIRITTIIIIIIIIIQRYIDATNVEPEIYDCTSNNWSHWNSNEKLNLETIPGKHSIDSLQKTAILGTSHIIRKVLQCEA